MSFLDTPFNLADLPEAQETNFDPIPAGWYDVSLTGAEVKDTKAGTGKYIAVRYDVVGPTHQGRIVWQNLNIQNPNPQAEEIGRRQLGDLMRAIGLSSLSDTDQLIGHSLKINVKVRPASNGWEASNDVSGVKAMGGSPAPSASAPQQQAAPQASSAPKAGAAPWAK